MEKKNLLEMIDNYKKLLDKKEQLDKDTKENDANIKSAVAAITDVMIDEEVPSVTRKGFKYTISPRIKFNKIGDARLAEKKVNFFKTLKEAGMGDLIKQTVNAKSLSSACKAAYEENGEELPDDLKKIVEPFEWMDISMRKDNSKK